MWPELMALLHYIDFIELNPLQTNAKDLSGETSD